MSKNKIRKKNPDSSLPGEKQAWEVLFSEEAKGEEAKD